MEKELSAKKMMEINSRNKNELEVQQREEEAFVEAEKEEIRKENNEIVKTKRIVDRMMTAAPAHLSNEICLLLSNYKGGAQT